MGLWSFLARCVDLYGKGVQSAYLLARQVSSAVSHIWTCLYCIKIGCK